MAKPTTEFMINIWALRDPTSSEPCARHTSMGLPISSFSSSGGGGITQTCRVYRFLKQLVTSSPFDIWYNQFSLRPLCWPL